MRRYNRAGYAPRPVNRANQTLEDPAIFARLRVEYWPIERLKPYERNPRKNDKAVDQIRASIREFGFAVPILAKSDGECDRWSPSA